MQPASNRPVVSVIMPVYNAAQFLRSAIESVLDQTFKDFELILINDGSTDNSAEIIRSFRDDRIILLNNEKNLGITLTLNKGIEKARGKYIARMDSDDISLPTRFQEQVDFLNRHPEAAVVATRIKFINTEGQITGEWDDDAKHVTAPGIRNAMAFSNCVAHPGIMMDAALLKKYQYKIYQKGSEDWDLWLRLLADGHIIYKLDKALLHYRIHPQSVMSGEKESTTLQQRLIKTKSRFIIHQLYKPNGYFFLVVYSLLRSIGSHYKFNVFPKLFRNLKRLLTTSPFKAVSQYNRLKKALRENKSKLLFFFPYTHIGGAERVHADITSVFKDDKPIIIFTGFSKDKKFLGKFIANGTVLNIPHALNYPLLRKKCLSLLANHLNEESGHRILGSNSVFFYDLCVYLNERVRISELIHAFAYEENGNNDHKKYFALSQKFTNRIFISSMALEQFKKFCFHQNCSPSYYDKLKLIYNYTPVLPLQKKTYAGPLNIVFVGRDSTEKRLDLFIDIAEQLDQKAPGKFTFTVLGAARDHRVIKFCGEVTNNHKIESYYNNAHLLVLTSSREGFPLVVMEAMAHGVVPVCTPVGDIPLHVHADSGFVTSSNEKNIVKKEMTDKILWLRDHSDTLNQLSSNAYKYAQQNFSFGHFATAYRSILGIK